MGTGSLASRGLRRSGSALGNFLLLFSLSLTSVSAGRVCNGVPPAERCSPHFDADIGMRMLGCDGC